MEITGLLGGEDECLKMETKKQKFFFLTLELPVLSIFKEQQELGTLPQIPIGDLLSRYDGEFHAYSEP